MFHSHSENSLGLDVENSFFVSVEVIKADSQTQFIKHAVCNFKGPFFSEIKTLFLVGFFTSFMSCEVHSGTNSLLRTLSPKSPLTSLLLPVSSRAP